MPKLKNRPPKLSKDKNYAIVYCNGTRLPMGKWGTPEADANYRRFLTEWATCSYSSLHRPGKQILIEDVVTAYLDWAKTHVEPAGYRHSKTVSQFVLELYFGIPVDDFGAKSLTTVQQAMVASGRFSRKHTNKLISRFRTILRWGIGQEMVHVNTVAALKYVLPLRKGQTTAHETIPREDVADATVEATLPHLPSAVRAMVQIQRLAVMRPNEVCRMTVDGIDKSRKDGIWLYQPSEHKRAWHEEGRIVPLGTPEQELLAPFLVDKTPEQAIFYTRTGRHFTTERYAGAVERSIKKANRSLPADQQIPHWTPYQLRHAGVTELVKANDGNRDIARAVAGQKSIKVTQEYNHADLDIAIEQAKKRSAKFGQ